MNFRYIHSIIGWLAMLLLLAFVSCEKDIVSEEELQDAPVAYLSVTRAQTSGQHTFNDDITDFEDRVHDLAVLIFDSSTGAKVGEYFDESIPLTHKVKTFTVETTPGTRDFYFVANMPMLALKAIADRTAMNAYMQAMNTLDPQLYQGATSTKGFPMSRVYTDQAVTRGGTAMNPIPFLPDGEPEVRLIRTVAKVEVIIEGNASAVEEIKYHNAFPEFRLGGTTGSYIPNEYATGPLKYQTAVGTTPAKYIYYTPEAIISGTTWNQATGNQPFNYFEIKTTAGFSYRIPIVANGGMATRYLPFVRGEEAGTPNFSVIRNQIYRFEVNLNTIEVFYTITDWTSVNKSVLMGYGYNVEVNGNNVTVTNTVKACAPHLIKLEPLGGTTIGGATAPVTFGSANETDNPAQLLDKASATYTLANVPASGDYLKVYYNGALVKTYKK